MQFKKYKIYSSPDFTKSFNTSFFLQLKQLPDTNKDVLTKKWEEEIKSFPFLRAISNGDALEMTDGSRVTVRGAIHMENQTWSSSNMYSLSKRNTIKRYRTLFTQTKSVFPVTWVTLLLHTDPRTFYTTPDWFKHNVAETIILFKCLLLCFLTMNINQITACNLFWLH